MTPQEYIEAMCAGWNLGSNYDGSWYDKVNNKYRYWCCNGAWQYKVGNGSYSNISVFKESYGKSDHLLSFKFSFTPTENEVTISLKHPIISETTETLPIKIVSATVAGTATVTLVDSLTFPVFSGKVSTLTIDLTTLFSESVLNKAVVLNVKIDSENLSYYPTNDSSVLSYLRSYTITRVISRAGFSDVNELVIKAVAAAGFKSIRIPIMWYSHCDVLTGGHVHVDTEFLDHLATVLGWCHTHGLLVCINMHHDDNTRDCYGWLTTTQYIADPEVPIIYKDIWEQVATYFKDYGDWLSFASNNETLNDSQHWENPSTADVWGIKMMQKDFYDVVRSISGNETRICIYPTYAAKTSCLNSTWVDPSDSSNTGKWDLPYNDAYGIAEIHPYAASSVDNVRVLAKIAKNKHIPIIYGEFGNASWNDKTSCWVTAYQVGLANYYGHGTFIWDDDGGMRILNRRSVTASNYANKSLWAGYLNEFIPSLTKNAPLREAEILLNNRRQSAYMGDTVSICLDTDKHIYVSNEGSSAVAINNGNQVVVGSTDINDLLAISYDGKYNTIDISVDEPQHWIDEVHDDISEWLPGGYSVYGADGVKVVTGFICKYPDETGQPRKAYHLPLYTITSPVTIVEWYNAKEWCPVIITEYDASKNMISNYNTYGIATYNHGTYAVNPAAKYIGIAALGPANGDFPTFETGKDILTIRTRDMSATEEKDLTDSYVDSITDYSNFNASLHRTIDVSGGMEYQLDLGNIDCNVYIREFNGEKLEAEYWLENGDTFKTNLFTKSMRIEIEVPNANINEVVAAMNRGALRPTLSYTDYATHQSEYDEEFTPIHRIDTTNRVVGVGNKLLSRNGKVIKA